MPKLLMIMFALAAPAIAQEKQGSDDAPSDGSRTLSPLHSYLGIDAESGEFSDGKPATTSASGEPPVDTTRPEDAAEKAAEEARQVIERLATGDAQGLNELLGGVSRSPVGETVRVAATASIAILLVFPLALVLVELLAANVRRQEDLDEADRRHFRRRRRLRLCSAAAAGVVIGLLAWGQWEWYWADEPSRLIPFAAGLVVAAVAWATFAGLVRRADAEYPALLLRSVRDRQAKLGLDLADLRRRLAKSTGASS